MDKVVIPDLSQPSLLPKYVKRREAQPANLLDTVDLCTLLPSIPSAVLLHHQSTSYLALPMQRHDCGVWTRSRILSHTDATKIRFGMSNGAPWEFISQPLVGIELRNFGQLTAPPV